MLLRLVLGVQCSDLTLLYVTMWSLHKLVSVQACGSVTASQGHYTVHSVSFRSDWSNSYRCKLSHLCVASIYFAEVYREVLP